MSGLAIERDEVRRKSLAEECEQRLARVRALIDELAAEVNPLVTNYGQLAALATRLGSFERAPDVRAGIADLLLSRLCALRPFIPFVSDPDWQE